MFKKICLIATLLFSTTALAGGRPTREIETNYINGVGVERNFVLNPGAEKNVANVTAANSATVAQNTTTPIEGVGDFDIALPNNTTGSVTWTLATIDPKLSGQSCELKVYYTASSIGSAVKLDVLNGVVVVASSANLATAATSTLVSVPVSCGTLASATTVRIANQTGNAGTSSVKIDGVYYGLLSITGFSGASALIGSANIPSSSNCTGWVTGSGTLVAFSADTDCVGPTVEINPGPGTISTTDTDLPEFTVTGLPAGNYQVIMQAYLESTGNVAASLAINDGTDTRGRASAAMTAALGTPVVVVANFSYASSGNRTFSLYGSSTGSNIIIRNDTLATPNGQLTFSIIKL